MTKTIWRKKKCSLTQVIQVCSNVANEIAFLTLKTGDPRAVFGWEGEVDPPMIISHRGHHHRPRGFPSPFPLFPGGPRDPLGGTFSDFMTSILSAARGGNGPITLEMPATVLRNRTNPQAVPDYRYRSHRPGRAPPRSTDDGTNPLLQRNGSRGPSRDNSHRHQSMGGWIQAMGGPPGADLSDIIGFGGRPFGEGPGIP